MIEIKILNTKSFENYGDIIEFNEEGEHNFQVIVKESKAEGWRIALKKIIERECFELGIHPDSRESFEPLQGSAVLCVAKKETPEDIEMFLLDKPVCLYKNIWHNLISLGETSMVKITENNTVSAEVYTLPWKIRIEGVIKTRK